MAADPFYQHLNKHYTWHVVGQFAAIFLLGGWEGLIWAGCLRTVWVYHITWFVNSAAHAWGYQDYRTGAPWAGWGGAGGARCLAAAWPRAVPAAAEAAAATPPHPACRRASSHRLPADPCCTPCPTAARPAGDQSRNNWWVGLLGFGEGWHNNHHAFEFSARHGLEPYQYDMTWCAPARDRACLINCGADCLRGAASRRRRCCWLPQAAVAAAAPALASARAPPPRRARP